MGNTMRLAENNKYATYVSSCVAHKCSPRNNLILENIIENIREYGADSHAGYMVRKKERNMPPLNAPPSESNRQ